MAEEQANLAARDSRKGRGAARLRIGLEGKLLTGVMGLLCASMVATCLIWANRFNERMTDVLGEQARQVANALSLAARPAMENHRPRDLDLICNDILQSHNMLSIAAYDLNGDAIAKADRPGMSREDDARLPGGDMQQLMKLRRMHSLVFGDYLQVCAPVFGSAEGSPTGSDQLIGYVAVGISPAMEQRQLSFISIMSIAVVIGGVSLLLCLPLAYAMVHRLFRPIRELVKATNQLAAGQLDAHVDVDRGDSIGELARSFNAMAQTIQSQQRELLQANEQLEQANIELEEKVVQRTAQLEMANMRLKNEIAEKEDFLRAVSHDLNAPLRNISGMAAMLLMKHREKFDEEIVHRLERIQKNVEVETDLISELLELSRIKTRRQVMESVEIGALVRELEGIFENDLKTQEISLVIDGTLPVLHGERARFRQIFQNLIDNAIKYMGDSPVREIHVGCRMRATEVELYVRDTGMGIHPDDVSKVFFIFRRGRTLGSKNITGKGVGLASVKSIVETYNGSIWVESKLNQGSTFRFTINRQYLQGDQPKVAVVATGESVA